MGVFCMVLRDSKYPQDHSVQRLELIDSSIVCPNPPAPGNYVSWEPSIRIQGIYLSKVVSIYNQGCQVAFHTNTWLKYQSQKYQYDFFCINNRLQPETFIILKNLFRVIDWQPLYTLSFGTNKSHSFVLII